MSQHSQRNQYGPSVGSVITGLALTLSGGTAVAYMLSGPLTVRAIVGAVLGAAFTALMGLQTLERAVERRVALDRIARREERAERERREAALRDERLRREAEERERREAALRDERLRREAEERRLRADWERATYGPEPVQEEPVYQEAGLDPEELERSRERAGDAWDEVTYGVEPDPVATQPVEPDPGQVEHWATGGEIPSQPDAYSVPMYPLPEEREPARYPYHPRPVDQPDWADRRDWPTEVIERQG
jgi:hypothetical protein